MKKNIKTLLLSALVTAPFILTGCSNDDEPIAGNSTSANEIAIAEDIKIEDIKLTANEYGHPTVEAEKHPLASQLFSILQGNVWERTEIYAIDTFLNLGTKNDPSDDRFFDGTQGLKFLPNQSVEWYIFRYSPDKVVEKYYFTNEVNYNESSGHFFFIRGDGETVFDAYLVAISENSFICIEKKDRKEPLTDVGFCISRYEKADGDRVKYLEKGFFEKAYYPNY